MTTYPSGIQDRMRRFFIGLDEKQRRCYAAVEAEKLGHGGIGYISKLLGIDPKTIHRGQEDLSLLSDLAGDRIRMPGGGRPKKWTDSPA